MIVSVSGAAGVLVRVRLAFSLGTPKYTQLNAIMMVGAVDRLLLPAVYKHVHDCEWVQWRTTCSHDLLVTEARCHRQTFRDNVVYV